MENHNVFARIMPTMDSREMSTLTSNEMTSSSGNFLPKFLDRMPNPGSPQLQSRYPHQADVHIDYAQQFSGLREVMKEIKLDIVRELELVVRRELSSNFEKAIAAVRNAQPFEATEIGQRLITTRVDEQKLEHSMLAHLPRLPELGINHVQLHQVEPQGSPSETSEPDKIPQEASVALVRNSGTSSTNPHSHGGHGEILKAVVQGRREMFDLRKLDPNLILHDVKLDHFDKPFTHCSLLALAAMAGRRSHVSLLVSMKASLDSTYGFLAGSERQDWSGPVATSAVVSNNMPMFKLLLELKANPATEASNGANLLWQCAYFGRAEMLELCLSSEGGVSETTLGKMAEFQNQKGVRYSPLHISVLMAMTSCSRLLLNAKASIELENEAKETPLDTALHFCHPELVTLLIKKGARIVETEDFARTNSGDTSVSNSMPNPEGAASRFGKRRFASNRLRSGLKNIFAKRELNTVLVHAVAVGLQSQPEQVQMLDPSAILDFWRTDARCMTEILKAIFAERRLRYRSKTSRAIRERKTAVVKKSDVEKNCVYNHKIIVSTRFCYDDLVALDTSGASPSDAMKKFMSRLTPQDSQEFNNKSWNRFHNLHHVPVIVCECLVPSIHNDLRFLKGLANADRMDEIFLTEHCQAIVQYSWARARGLAVVRCIAHFALLAFFIYVVIVRHYIGSNGLKAGMLEYDDHNLRVRWIALVILPLWLFGVVYEFIEFAVHVEHGWAVEYLTDLDTLRDMVRISLDGLFVISFMLWGFDTMEDIHYRFFLGMVCALKWAKILYSLTPFRRVGLPVLPIIFTLRSIVPSVAIMLVYFSGLAHAVIALDRLPSGLTMTFLHSFMFGVSGDLQGEAKYHNNYEREDFEEWWLRLVFILATFSLPITFMNIFIAAMSSSYEHAISHVEELYQSRCVRDSFSQACIIKTLKRRLGSLDKEREKRLWYCRGGDWEVD